MINRAFEDAVRLRPSFLSGSAVLIAWVALIATFAYLREGYSEHHWWTKTYALTLIIPVTFFLLFIWLAAVPQRLEFSASEFRIKFRLGKPHNRSWDELDLYGWGEGVFVIQFVDGQSFGIFPSAYPRSQWRQLRDFLRLHFPEKRASGYFGARLFKWRRARKRG